MGRRTTTGDEILKEFIELATGREIGEDYELLPVDFCVPITEGLIKKIAVIGLATLVYHARRGDIKSSQYLVDRCIGLPEPGQLERINEMGLDEVKAELAKEFSEGLAISESVARDVVERLIERGRTDG
ncbi:MAG: hypothetical protein V2G41_10105 [bacterium JZ-2024 1]